MTVGDDLPHYRIPFVDPAGMRAWAGLLRDPNPIHLDVAAVEAAGLGDRRINQGPANIAYMMDMLRAAFPGWQIAAFEARFLGNVLEGDALVAGGQVTCIKPDEISCDIWLDTHERGRAIAGVARMTRRFDE